MRLVATGEGRFVAGFLALLVLALALRLWDLTGRTMHYDEAIHLYYSWRLANLEGFVHSPWMHGPFQIELVAVFLGLLGDSDFVARLAYALFGTALVGLPFFLREHLGRYGALITGFMLAVSPSLLYFSRFGRNDIIMAVLTVSLFALLWQYTQNPRNRYLFLASAVLAVAFATKETAYIIAAMFGLLALLLAIPYSGLANSLSNLWNRRKVPGSTQPEWDLEGDGSGGPIDEARFSGGRPARLGSRLDIGRLNPAGGFLVLLITLTLPLWSAGVELAREVGVALAGILRWGGAREALENGFGLTLVGRDAASQGIVGAPVWEAPFVQLPLPEPWPWIAGALVLLVVVACVVAGWRRALTRAGRLGAIILPVAASYVAGFALLRPTGTAIDLLLVSLMAAICLCAFALLRIPWRQSFFLLFVPFVATLTYFALLLPMIELDSLLPSILPEGVEVASSGNGAPLNYLVAGGVILGMMVLAWGIGLWWKGGVWLACAVIFGTTWLVLYTTFFTNLAGAFSGAWQGMGYWIAQQEVARGNQPWYYYLVGLSVYEFLPLLFGLIAAVLFTMRRDRFGMALAFWAGVNLLAYTIASEKMPWLLVNITLPFIFLAGELLGELVERVQWRYTLESSRRLSSLMVLAIPAFLIVAGGYAALRLTEADNSLSYTAAILLLVIFLLAVTGAWLVRQSGAGNSPALATLGIAGTLAAATAWMAFQASYVHDDSRLEILVYAQGSHDLRQALAELDQQYFQNSDSELLAEPVRVDYDIWYPLQWYVRHNDQEGQLRFTCFRDEDGSGGCSSPLEGPAAAAFLVASHHRPSATGSMQGSDQLAPRRNLLWFPETYRRPGEDRQGEGALEEVMADLEFFREAATSREKWHQALKFVLKRDMESDWFKSEYYTYLSREAVDAQEAP